MQCTFYSQYLYSLLLYVVNNKHQFIINGETHNYVTRSNNSLHLPTVNFSKLSKRAYITSVKGFNHLQQYIKSLVNDPKCFKSALKMFYVIFLSTQSMNTMILKRIDEYKP